MSAAATDELGTPPAAKEGITKMGDAFRKQMQQTLPANTAKVPPVAATAPPTPPPAPKPTEAPVPPKDSKPVDAPPAPTPAPQPPTDPTMPKNAKDWKAHNEVKEKAIAEAKQARAEAEALKQEAATLKAEMETLRKGTAEYERVKAEFDGTKKQLQEYQGIINQFALEQDPQFQAHYGEKRKLGVDIAKSVVTTPDQAARLDEILSMPPSKLRDEQLATFGAELNDFQRVQLASAYVQIATVEREKQKELSRSAENLALVREANQKKQQMEQAAREAQQKTFVDTVYQRIDPELEGVEDAATFKEQMRQLATNSLDSKGFLEVAGYAAKGRKHDAVVNALKEENAKLQAQVQELTAAQPNANGTGGSQPVRRTNGSAPDQTGQVLGNRFRQELAKRQGQK